MDPKEQKSNDIDSAIAAAYLAMKPYDPMTADRALQIASIKIRHDFENERREGMFGLAAMFQGAEFVPVPNTPEGGYPPPLGQNTIVQGDFNKRAGALSPEEIEKLHKEDTTQ